MVDTAVVGFETAIEDTVLIDTAVVDSTVVDTVICVYNLRRQ